MIPNLYIGNGCFAKHLFINGCLGFQAGIYQIHIFSEVSRSRSVTDSINIGEDDGDDVDEGRDGDDGMEEEMEPLGRA